MIIDRILDRKDGLMNVTKISELTVDNQTYILCKADDGKIWGIQSEWITDGKLNREINGIEGNRRNTLPEVIQQIRMTHATIRNMEQGMPHLMAVIKAAEWLKEQWD